MGVPRVLLPRVLFGHWDWLYAEEGDVSDRLARLADRLQVRLELRLQLRLPHGAGDDDGVGRCRADETGRPRDLRGKAGEEALRVTSLVAARADGTRGQQDVAADAALRDPGADILKRVVRVAGAELVQLEEDVLLSFDCVGHVPIVPCAVGPTGVHTRSWRLMQNRRASQLPPIPGRRRLRRPS